MKAEGRVFKYGDNVDTDVIIPARYLNSFDAKELGMVACKTVLDVIEGAEVETRTLLPYEVVLKESTK